MAAVSAVLLSVFGFGMSVPCSGFLSWQSRAASHGDEHHQHGCCKDWTDPPYTAPVPDSVLTLPGLLSEHPTAPEQAVLGAACFESTVVALYDYVVPKPKSECNKLEQLEVSFAAGYIAGTP